LKGSIDLDQCHQVDCGLSYKCGKISRSNLFNIQTKHRIYYLSADTFEEMNSWVQSLCQACGLRPYQSEEDEGKETRMLQDASPETPQSTTSQTHISGPYMHLSECFTGGGGPPSKHVRGGSDQCSRPVPDSSFLSYGDDSVFSSSSLSGNKSIKRCDDDLPSQFSTLQVGSYIPPSRPPKPAGLRNQPVQLQNADGENYENFQSAQKMSELANQRELNINNNNNAAPGQPSYPTSLPVNLLGSAPPQVDRRLKPFRKYSHGDSATLPPGGFEERQQFAATSLQNGRSIRRIHQPQPSDSRLVNLDRASSEESIHSRRNSEEEETIYFYMPSLQNGDDGRYPIMIPEEMIGQKVEYLDLDLPSPNTQRADTKTIDDSSSTIYKTVDFFKTEAFNRTKKSVENERYNMPSS